MSCPSPRVPESLHTIWPVASSMMLHDTNWLPYMSGSTPITCPGSTLYWCPTYPWTPLQIGSDAVGQFKRMQSAGPHVTNMLTSPPMVYRFPVGPAQAAGAKASDMVTNIAAIAVRRAFPEHMTLPLHS